MGNNGFPETDFDRGYRAGYHAAKAERAVAPGSASTNSAMDAIAEQVVAFVLSVGASDWHAKFLNQFVEWCRQRHQ